MNVTFAELNTSLERQWWNTDKLSILDKTSSARNVERNFQPTPTWKPTRGLSTSKWRFHVIHVETSFRTSPIWSSTLKSTMPCESFFEWIEIHISLLVIVENLPRLDLELWHYPEGLKIQYVQSGVAICLSISLQSRLFPNIYPSFSWTSMPNIRLTDKMCCCFDFQSYPCHLVWCPHTSPRFFWPSVSSFIASTTSFHQTSISSISSPSSTPISPLFSTPHTSQLYPLLLSYSSSSISPSPSSYKICSLNSPTQSIQAQFNISNLSLPSLTYITHLLCQSSITCRRSLIEKVTNRQTVMQGAI